MPAMQEILDLFLGWEDLLEKDRLHIPLFLGFPCGSAGKESACNAGDLGSIHELGRFLEEGTDYPFQYSGLENSMDCIVNGVARSWTLLRNFHFHSQDTFNFPSLLWLLSQIHQLNLSSPLGGSVV